MHTYSLIIELSPLIQSQIASLCFGPPQISWIEKQNIYFLVYAFGHLSDLELKSLQEGLEAIFFQPFTFKLQGLKSTKFKGKGIIGLETVAHSTLSKLQQDLDKLSRALKLKKLEPSPFPLILGYYENLNFERLIDYLGAYSSFESSSIEVTGLSLISTNSSGKNSVYNAIAHYAAFEMLRDEE